MIKMYGPSNTNTSPLALQAVQNAMHSVGIHEQPPGSNWGPEVSVWLKRVLVPVHASWCMAFVYCMFDDAARILKIRNPVAKTAGCLRQLALSHGNKIDFPTVLPIAGDIFILDFGHGLGHCGIISGVTPPAIAGGPVVVETVEGNSNTDGSRNGEAVVNHQRIFPTALLAGILRF